MLRDQWQTIHMYKIRSWGTVIGEQCRHITSLVLLCVKHINLSNNAYLTQAMSRLD